MRKFILSLIVIIVGVFLLDRIGGSLMWWVNQHTGEAAGVKTKHMAYSVNEDVILLGTSRCNLHYVPSIISDSIGMSVYNGGINASDNIYSHYILLNLILSHHTPKIIGVEVSNSDIVKQPDPFASVSFFAPYFGENSSNDSIFRYANLFWPYKLFHLYRFNAKATSSIAGLFSVPEKVEDDGYIALPKPARPIKTPPLKDTSPIDIDNLKMDYLQRFINICKEKDIKLVFMISPCYSVVDNHNYDAIKDVALRNGIQVLDYHTIGLFHDHPSYFSDIVHLWDMGARIYSSIFAHNLKQVLEME